jgi:hypothetical protein
LGTVIGKGYPGKRKETVNTSSMGAEAQTTLRPDRKAYLLRNSFHKELSGMLLLQHYSLELSHPNLILQCFGIPCTLTMSNTQHYQHYHGTLFTPFVRLEAKATWHAEGCEATHHSLPCDPHGPGHSVFQVDYIPLSPGMSP